METVQSKDGTIIAYDRYGQGPAVIMVDGAFGTRAFYGPTEVAKRIAPGLTAIVYDRRGRGDSTDTQPYAVERELEDIQALIDALGGSAYLYGISSGAVLALYAAAKLPGVTRLALFEPPLIVAGDRPAVPATVLDELKAQVAAGKRGDAVLTFVMKVMGAPGIVRFILPLLPDSKKMQSVVHTAIYDLTVMGDFTITPVLSQAMSAITAPTLVMGGGKSPAWMQNTAGTVAGCIPGAALKMLPGQTHEASPKVVAPALSEFFNG